MASKTLQLPCGLETDGRIERTAEIGKLKGKVQRDIARIANKKNADMYHVIEAILKPSVQTIGSEPASGTILGALLLADRDFLLFEIVKHSRGPIVTLRADCPKCDEAGEYPGYDLDDLPITHIEDGDALWWDGQNVHSAVDVSKMGPEERVGLKYRVFRIADEELGVTAVFRYPTGRHQQGISKMGDNEIEALWKLMSTTMLQWKDPEIEVETAPKGGVKMTFWDEVDMEILDWAQLTYAEAMPGVDSKVELECPSCEHEFDSVMRPTDFLFRGRRKEKVNS